MNFLSLFLPFLAFAFKKALDKCNSQQKSSKLRKKNEESNGLITTGTEVQVKRNLHDYKVVTNSKKVNRQN